MLSMYDITVRKKKKKKRKAKKTNLNPPSGTFYIQTKKLDIPS